MGFGLFSYICSFFRWSLAGLPLFINTHPNQYGVSENSSSMLINYTAFLRSEIKPARWLLQALEVLLRDLPRTAKPVGKQRAAKPVGRAF